MTISSGINSLISYCFYHSYQTALHDQRNNLANKIDSLINKILTEEFYTSEQDGLVFMKMPHPFYRRHPLAPYSDPGKEPKKSKDKEKWVNQINKDILPKQMYLNAETETLRASSELLKGNTQGVVDNIDLVFDQCLEPRAQMRTQLISIVALENLNPHSLTTQEKEVTEGLLSKLSLREDTIVMGKNILKGLYLNYYLQGKLPTDTDLKIFSHVEQAIKKYDSDSFYDFWIKYTSENPGALVFFALVLNIHHNLYLLNNNNITLYVNGEPIRGTNIDFLNKDTDWFLAFFSELVKPRDLENDADDWRYTQNVCEIHNQIKVLDAF